MRSLYQIGASILIGGAIVYGLGGCVPQGSNRQSAIDQVRAEEARKAVLRFESNIIRTIEDQRRENRLYNGFSNSPNIHRSVATDFTCDVMYKRQKELTRREKNIKGKACKDTLKLREQLRR